MLSSSFTDELHLVAHLVGATSPHGHTSCKAAAMYDMLGIRKDRIEAGELWQNSAWENKGAAK